MSLALYRTYRPGRFSDVIGQDHVTVPLSRALAHDRIHHAYLFTGPRGCGKTSSARILARSLNCEQGPTPDPCGVCQSCIDLAPNGPGSLDVIELDAASHGGVDDTRDLRERAMFAPVSSRYKIYIIDEAHMVTTAGFNALLKLIEEPPPHVRFVFATTEADKVLPTIRSRTHQYAFRLVPAPLLAEHLAKVCHAEGIEYEPAALTLVARAGEGSVRDSLSILGQLIGGASDEGITYADAVTQLGFTADHLLDEVVGALSSSDGPALFSAVEAVVAAGHDPRRFVTDLLERLRDLIVLAAAPEAASSGLISAPSDRLAALQAQAESLGLAELSRAADIVSSGLSEIKGATAPRLQLELLAARLLLPAADDGQQGTRARLDRLERRVAGLGEGLVLPGPAGEHVAPAAVAGPPHPPARPAVPPGPVVDDSLADSVAPAAPPASGPAAPTAARRGGPPRLSDVAPATAPAGASAPPVPAPAPAPASDTAGAAAAEPATEAAAPVPAAPAGGGDAGADLGSVRTMWPAVLEKLKLDSRVAWTCFERSVPLSVDGGVLTVGVPEAPLLARARERGDDVRLREAVLAVMRVDLRPEAVLAPGAATRVAPPPAPGEAPGGSAAGEPAAGEPSVPAPDASAAEPAPDASTLRRRAEAAAREPEADPVADDPSDDDPDVDSLSGVELVARELGATVVTDYDGG